MNIAEKGTNLFEQFINLSGKIKNRVNLIRELDNSLGKGSIESVSLDIKRNGGESINLEVENFQEDVGVGDIFETIKMVKAAGDRVDIIIKYEKNDGSKRFSLDTDDSIDNNEQNEKFINSRVTN